MSNPASFCLLSKDWIPVVNSDKTKKGVGIRNALLQAHEIHSISHTAPFIEFGLYRLLITIVLDAYIVAGKRPTIGIIKTLIEDGAFDGEVIGKYVDKYKGRFNLWTEQDPFLQRDAGNIKKKSIVSMFSAIPSATNVTHWHHYTEDEMSVAECVAAQFLTAVSPWNFKTKPGEARTLAGDPPMYALVVGQSLFETIVLNLPRPSGRSSLKQEIDNGPAWRTTLDLSRLPKSPTVSQGYTWPVRVVALQYDGAVVSKTVNQAAYKKPTEKAKKKGGILYEPRGWRDPNAGTITSNDILAHIKARPGVPVWRDAVPLFLVSAEGEALRGDRRRSRPEVITNALRVLETPQFRVAVYGMRKKSGGGGDVKVEEWFRSTLTLPTEVARDSRISASAIEAFRSTQRVADALQTALSMLRPPVKASKSSRPPLNRCDGDGIADFWQALEPILGHTFVQELENDVARAEQDLWERVRRAALAAFQQAASPHNRTADGLFRIANASNWFERRLFQLFPTRKSERKS